MSKKKNKWISMDSINHLSQFAQKVTMASYVYPYGTIRERYALLRGSNWSSLEDSTYFNYRKFFNYEETDLAFFDPYIDYVLNFLNEKSDLQYSSLNLLITSITSGEPHHLSTFCHTLLM